VVGAVVGIAVVEPAVVGLAVMGAAVGSTLLLEASFSSGGE